MNSATWDALVALVRQWETDAEAMRDESREMQSVIMSESLGSAALQMMRCATARRTVMTRDAEMNSLPQRVVIDP